MKKVISIVALIALTGCASHGEYYASIERANALQVEAAQAKASADAERIAALTLLAESGDESAKIAAVVSLAMMGQQGDRQVQMIQPRPQQSEALQWAQTLVPFAGLAMQSYYGYSLGKVQSDNNAAVAISGQEAYTELGLGEFREGVSPRFAPDDSFPLGEGRDALIQPQDSFDLGEGR